MCIYKDNTQEDSDFTTLGVAALDVVTKLRKQMGQNGSDDEERNDGYCQRRREAEIEKEVIHGTILIFALRRTR